jgi:hypothetical protein
MNDFSEINKESCSTFINPKVVIVFSTRVFMRIVIERVINLRKRARLSSLSAQQ